MVGKSYFFDKFNKSFVLINFALFVDVARDLQLNWDALTLWKLKANHFYVGNNYFDPTYYPDTYFAHPQYPHLGTYIWAFFWKNSVLDYEYLGRTFQIYLYVVSLFVFSVVFFLYGASFSYCMFM